MRSSGTERVSGRGNSLSQGPKQGACYVAELKNAGELMTEGNFRCGQGKIMPHTQARSGDVVPEAMRNTQVFKTTPELQKRLVHCKSGMSN